MPTFHFTLQMWHPLSKLEYPAAIRYLQQIQRNDGGWSENPSLSLPDSAIELTTTESITWLTADIIELYRLIEWQKSDVIKKAIKWLRDMQNPDGGWSMWKGGSI